MATQACLHARSTTVPPPTTNPCRFGCNYCNVGHNGACPVDDSGAASCPASYHETTGFGNRGRKTTQPRPRVPMQASAAPTRRPVPCTPSPLIATLLVRLSCGAWKWTRRARPPPTLAEAVMVFAMLLLGPMTGLTGVTGVTGRGGCALPPAQTKALEELYNAANGPSWRYSPGWMTGDPCTGGWFGVTCNQGMDEVVYVHACELAPRNVALL
jgi:hypothetical protein